ncbi:DNA translocase FtsK [Paenibacillus sp. BSR1-1]|uniref:DNA translocase FtsK n=1 Tax=Paenibacillus sp. BSR1-1 TaxID=3020845 RepID=UPI0025B0A565|nr:DNA translocase FtsK [Paenibacillus sp. BSR1-1]MDN3018195.1 DNA translocase FtsK [Paenibacillus sp. BSR1-1]
MSWIQDFFQRFKKDEEEEFNHLTIQNKNTNGHPILNNDDNIKDLEIRISYQYPKGEFKTSYSSISKRRTIEETPVIKRRAAVIPEKRVRKEKTERQTVQKEMPKENNKVLIPKKEQPERIRGPFHPTEIPSPVFGFNRPKKIDSIIEHELSHFLEEEFESNLDSIAATAETVYETEEIVSVKDHNNMQIGVKEEEMAAVVSLPVEPEQSENLNNTNDVAEEIVVEKPIEQLETSRPMRSKLPFNVMMLKQDKEKWEARKSTRREEREQRPIIESSKIESVQASTPEPEKKDESCQPPASQDGYRFPDSGLLNPPILEEKDNDWILYLQDLLNQTLQNFNVGASVVNVTQGPSVTRFEVQPEPGVKVNKITNLSDDIKLSLAARDIRIEAPIPGKHTIGIEVPNQKSRPVMINEIIGNRVFQESASPLTAVLGLDIGGNPIVTDLKKMPHGLIAGATGSGKSVCINTILVSLLFKASPDDLKLLLIDPKMVELAPYNRIPHLVSPVITDVKAATAALKWAVEEMERRYELFAHTGVRDISRFNELAMQHKRYSDKLPFIVIIIDELADLMMMSPADVEEAICRIAQKARACGIHLIVATQRPSVDVITGLIKANIPTRIAFSVSSQVDSRTIIDISGAEKLLGRGDMLFLENGSSKPVRLQGTFVSDEEIDIIVAHVREQREPDYLFEQEELLKKAQVTEEEDELFFEACEFIVDQGGASTSSLQRRFKIGYNRAARLMDMLEQNGYITSANGSKARDVLITEADLESIQDSSNIG